MEQNALIACAATGASLLAASWLLLKRTNKGSGAVIDEVEEKKAVSAIESAIKAAVTADANEEIKGIDFGVQVPLYAGVRGKIAPQYKDGQRPGERPLCFTYFNIRGLGEVMRLMLAEVGASYDSLMMVGGEQDGTNSDWRARSPNGLLPIISGLGIPHSQPLSQSGAIIRFLASRYGMMGKCEAEAIMADVLYETAKDLHGKKEEILKWFESGEKLDDSQAKGHGALALRIEKMLRTMPDPSNRDAALTFGQVQLLHTLMALEDAKSGCVKKLNTGLDKFRMDCVSRSRIAAYLNSGLRCPLTLSELGKGEGLEGYAYANGPVKRSAFWPTQPVQIQF